MSRRSNFVADTDGSVVYVTADGDMIDEIAHTYYGSHLGNTERVLDANPGLANMGAVFPAGVVIKLPALPTTPQATAFRRLWD